MKSHEQLLLQRLANWFVQSQKKKGTELKKLFFGLINPALHLKIGCIFFSQISLTHNERLIDFTKPLQAASTEQISPTILEPPGREGGVTGGQKG